MHLCGESGAPRVLLSPSDIRCQRRGDRLRLSSVPPRLSSGTIRVHLCDPAGLIVRFLIYVLYHRRELREKQLDGIQGEGKHNGFDIRYLFYVRRQSEPRFEVVWLAHFQEAKPHPDHECEA